MDRYPDDPLTGLIARFHMIPPRSRVLCAVSGGADSVYLLCRLVQLREELDFELAAAHYNHRLRGAESDRDEAFVRSFVRRHCPGVELWVGSGDVRAEALRRGTGLEETARALRYDFLEETAEGQGCCVIATAHTADDNAETLLLHLARGAGLHGLAGIPPVRGRLIRPLLTTTRTQVEDYLRDRSIPHVEDSTNSDDTYRRNKVRHQLIPLLSELNPGFLQSSVGTLDHLREEDALLERLALDRLDGVRAWGGGLSVPASAIALAPPPIAARMVRQLLARLGAWQFSAAHLEAVAGLCRGDNPSAGLDLPHGLTARRVYGDLCLGPAGAAATLPTLPLYPETGQTAQTGLWRVTCRLALAPERHPEDLNHVFLDREKVEPPLVLRPRRTGDGITLPRRSGKSLKKLFIDAKVPRADRDLIPILADCRGPLFVPGFGPDARRLAEPGGPALEITAEKIDGKGDEPCWNRISTTFSSARSS